MTCRKIELVRVTSLLSSCHSSVIKKWHIGAVFEVFCTNIQHLYKNYEDQIVFFHKVMEYIAKLLKKMLRIAILKYPSKSSSIQIHTKITSKI